MNAGVERRGRSGWARVGQGGGKSAREAGLNREPAHPPGEAAGSAGARRPCRPASGRSRGAGSGPPGASRGGGPLRRGEGVGAGVDVVAARPPGGLGLGAGGRDGRRLSREAEVGEDGVDGIGGGDGGEDLHGAGTARTGEEVVAEDATEELGPGEPGRAASRGGDLRRAALAVRRGAGAAGNQGGDGAPEAGVGGEDAVVSGLVLPGRGDQDGEAAEEGDGSRTSSVWPVNHGRRRRYATRPAGVRRRSWWAKGGRAP